jgi:signal transduction histidine kinase
MTGVLVHTVMGSLVRSVAQARTSEARWRSLVGSLPDIVLNVRADGRILLGTALDEGWTHLEQAVAESDRDLLDEALACAFDHARPASCELRGAKDDVWYAVRIAPIEEHGRVVAATVILTDCTAQRRADGERRRLEEQLRQSQKMEALGQLAGGIAHDFNNVLTVIGGNAEALSQHADAEAQPLLAEILRGRDRAEALTRQLLAFGRRQVLKPAVQPLDDVVAGVVAMLQRLTGEARLVVRPGDAGCVRVDRGQLEQVIVNLVVNARDAVARAGRIEVRTEALALDAPREIGGTRVAAGRWAVLVVEDEGCGMDAATRREIFQPFFTTKPVGEGTGLGLATVYGIVSQSGGVIGVESEPGRGTIVRVFLPACGDEA